MTLDSWDWIFWIVWAVGIFLVIAYGWAMLFGAPYLPTLKSEQDKVLDLLDLKPGQVFFDLGSGDGRLLELAAQRGLKAIGYEINPFLWFYSWLHSRRYGRKVKVKLGNFWHADLSKADGIFVFLITHHMKHLDELLSARQSKKPLKVVSNAFQIPGQTVVKKRGAMLLYIYK